MTNPNILVVEDDAKMQRLLASQLSMRGYNVRIASTGPEALIAAGESTPDIVLLDISLPELDGLEVCRRLREWSDVPIILVTASETPQTKVAALEMGGDDYLTKEAFPYGRANSENTSRSAQNFCPGTIDSRPDFMGRHHSGHGQARGTARWRSTSSHQNRIRTVARTCNPRRSGSYLRFPAINGMGPGLR